MKRYLLLTILAVAGLATAGCEDNRGKDMVPDRVYLRKSGAVELSAYVLGRGDETFELWACKGGTMGLSGNVKFSVNPDVLDAYNEALPENLKLEELPSDCYAIPRSTFSVSDEQPMAKFAFLYDPDVIADNYGTGRQFALPISISGSGIEVNGEQSSALIIFTVDRIEAGFQEYPSLTREVKSSDTEFREKLTVRIPAAAPEDVEVGISIDDQSYVDSFNDLYGTEYTLLPSSLVVMENPEPVIAEGASSVGLSMRINVRNLESGRFALPVVITSAGDIGIQDDRRVFYFLYHNSDEWLTTADDKAAWSIVNVSTNGFDGGTGPDRIIDGIGPGIEANYWGVIYGMGSGLYNEENGRHVLKPGLDQWVIIDLGESMKVGSVRWYPRSIGFDTVVDLEFYLADTAPDDAAYTPSYKETDGKNITGYNYTEMGGTYDIDEDIWVKAGEKKAAGGAISEVVFGTVTRGQFLMIRIPYCYDSAAMSEIDVLRIK